MRKSWKLELRTGERGFTMVEALIALSILAVVGLSLASATIGAIRANSTSRKATQAVSLMQQRVEELMALDPSVAADRAQLVSGSETLQQGEGSFDVAWEITQDEPKFGVSAVEVVVRWSDPEQRQIRSVAYVCRVAGCA